MLPRYLINPSLYQKIHNYSDCIIIGSGIAGLSTAVRLAKKGTIKVITKSSISESTTRYAQGGIAAALKAPDIWKNHYRDTMIAGQGLCDSNAVKILTRNAPKIIEDLINMGINFDTSRGEITFTTEGGHSFPRVLHAGGDATGEELEKKLVSYSKDLRNIDFLSGHFALDILVYKNSCAGITAMDLKTGVIEIYPASSVVIATGGIGQIYAFSTNPPISTGDGIAMAYRAGARIKDIEFIQFHPTVFKTKDFRLFLMTEAIRGEGAYLEDCNGKRFMVGKHPKAELAPRDIVVKEIIRVMDECRTDHVYLDARHIPESLLKKRFPNITLKLKENGLNLKKDLIEVSPAEHYINGGIETDYNGETNVKGLYSCGESAATGAHGANRLASNSLIEGAVYGWKIYQDIEKKLHPEKSGGESKVNEYIDKILKEAKRKKTEPEGPGNINDEVDNLIVKLKNTMTEKVGIPRDEVSLEEAGKIVNSYIMSLNFNNIKDKKTLELVNMLTVAGLIIKSAGIRKESRGTHQRKDFPKKDDINWKKHIILKQKKVYIEDA